jgi:hypothetical protein
MRTHLVVLWGVVLWVSTALGSTPGSKRLEIHTIDASVTDATTIFGAHKFMRSSDGTLTGSFIKHIGNNDELLLVTSKDGGKTWVDFSSGLTAKGGVRHQASDVGANGVYVAFVDGRGEGHVAHFPDPVGNPGKVKESGALTSEGGDARFSFISTSKGPDSTNSVGYGWLDMVGGKIYVGVSKDGTTFPPARLVETDSNATSGPAIAVHNNYVLVMYLTTSPEIAPDDPENLADTKGRDYQAWIESKDGGATWSKPAPLFGKKLADFPTVNASSKNGDGRMISGKVAAAGGTEALGNHSQTLAWAVSTGFDPAIAGGVRLFIMSALSPVTPKESPFPPGFWDDRKNNVGILSFKDIGNLTAPWTHVVASRDLVQERAGVVTEAWQHQYSALPGTSVRAVSYVDKTREQKTSHDSLVVSVSIDTGKHFDRFARFEQRDLGIETPASVVFVASPCLYKDPKGDVFIDVAFVEADAAGKVGDKRLKVTKLPIGLNVKDVPGSKAPAAQWP